MELVMRLAWYAGHCTRVHAQLFLQKTHANGAGEDIVPTAHLLFFCPALGVDLENVITFVIVGWRFTANQEQLQCFRLLITFLGDKSQPQAAAVVES